MKLYTRTMARIKKWVCRAFDSHSIHLSKQSGPIPVCNRCGAFLRHWNQAWVREDL
jgi:hypothetical protein